LYGGNEILYNTTTATSSSGSLNLNGVDMTLGSAVIARGYINYDGDQVLTHQLSVNKNNLGISSAGGTLLLFLALVFTLVLMFAIDPISPMVIFGVVLIVMNFTGLIAFGLPVITAIIVVIAVAVYRMRSV
jgi:hypothetical protein